MELYDDIRKRYEEKCSKRLSINMERGWPSKEQLELSMPMLGMVTENTDLCREDDYRGYAGRIYPVDYSRKAFNSESMERS